MKWLSRGALAAASLFALHGAACVGAAARDTRMLITVIDQTNAVIPDATVTVLGAEPATQKTEIPPVKTTANGLATIGGLTPGRYTARAEFRASIRAC